MAARNVLLLNGYSTLNLGDAALAYASIQAVRRTEPSADIAIVSMTPEIDEPRFASVGVRTVPDPIFGVLNSAEGRAARMFHAVTNWQAGLACARTGRTDGAFVAPQNAAFLQEVERADAAFSIGGGQLQDHAYGLWYLPHLYQLKATAEAGIPTGILCQSIGPFHRRISRWLVRRTLRRLDRVVVREHFSHDELKSFGLGTPQLALTSDLAFVLSPEPSAPAREWADELHARLASRPVVAMTVRDWVWPGPPGRGRTRFIEAMAAVVDGVAEHGFQTVLLPQVTGPAADDDRIISREVAERCASGAVFVAEDQVTPDHILAFLRGCALTVGTRMHSVIFSLLVGRPVVAVAYAKKTYGIMRELGLSEFVVDIRDVRPEEAVAKVRAALDQQEDLSGRIRARVARLRASVADVVDETVDHCLRRGRG